MSGKSLLIGFFIAVQSFIIAGTHSACAQSGALKVIIIRHGEKPVDGDNLSCAGMNRALKLSAVITQKFGKPDFAYAPAPSTGKATKNVRMLQTLWPLAIKYNLNINTKYAVGQTSALAANLLKRTGTVIVVWEHDNIPAIVTALGITDKKLKWKGENYDDIWIVTIDGKKRTLSKDSEGINPGSTCTF
ncbi:histidine phosphatase family protein [Mucilaginibacter sp. RS28]|uniref:Histidine phosphatase family protein n=1 Tax=Mucilaginibacter straminoryzae TaxID=2932774 RepID=A0A9X1X7Y9_9SPHI|nr:histidine phosphatase family protein [Mucilaginibacter straminoryzae]MCJ8211363.1 histidine phosphatase family protein [Mucilaginibacter straminoryzae]